MTRLRDVIADRDGYRCVACGSCSQLTFQHRISRGMGGAKYLDTLCNGIIMCLSCNSRLESDANFAERGRWAGWKLHRNRVGIDPEEVPVFYAWEGVWRLIHADGSRSATEAPEAA